MTTRSTFIRRSLRPTRSELTAGDGTPSSSALPISVSTQSELTGGLGETPDVLLVDRYRFRLPVRVLVDPYHVQWIPPPQVPPRFQGLLATFIEQVLDDGRHVMRKVGKSRKITLIHRYYDRVMGRRLFFLHPIQPPSGVLQISQYGRPVPSLPFLDQEGPIGSADRELPSSSWMYDHESPLLADMGSVMLRPSPNELPYSAPAPTPGPARTLTPAPGPTLFPAPGPAPSQAPAPSPTHALPSHPNPVRPKHAPPPSHPKTAPVAPRDPAPTRLEHTPLPSLQGPAPIPSSHPNPAPVLAPAPHFGSSPTRRRSTDSARVPPPTPSSDAVASSSMAINPVAGCGHQFPFVAHDTQVVDLMRVPWVCPPPVSRWPGSKRWTRYVMEKHPTTGQDVLVGSTKFECSVRSHQYFDRSNRIQIALDHPLLVPAGVVDIDVFGFPFPLIQCFASFATRKQGDVVSRRGRWLYLHEKPIQQDIGQKMSPPPPERLPALGAAPIVAVPSHRPVDTSEDEDENDDMPVMRPSKKLKHGGGLSHSIREGGPSSSGTGGGDNTSGVDTHLGGGANASCPTFDMSGLLDTILKTEGPDGEATDDATDRSTMSDDWDWDDECLRLFGNKDIFDDFLTDQDDDIVKEPERKRTPASGSASYIQGKMQTSIRRLMFKLVDRARQKSTVFDSFSYSSAIRSPLSSIYFRSMQDDSHPEPCREWMDNHPRIAVSSDGVEVLLHLPGGLGVKARETLYQATEEFARVCPPTFGGGADKCGRDRPTTYIRKVNEHSGIVKLVSGWHAIGRTREPVVASADLMKTGRRFSRAMALKEAFAVTSSQINGIIERLDPTQYLALAQLREAVHRKYPFARAIDSIDPSLMEGRAIMWNRQTALHADRSDPVRAWVPLLTLGEFRKGHLAIPRLNLRLSYEPGTIVLLRGHILPHEVEAWEGGQRVSIVWFTHQSLWDEFEMTCP